MPDSVLRVGALSLTLLGAAFADTAQARTRSQLMYTIGPLSGASGLHRPLDLTMKRGIVGDQHPDFLWSPRRMQPQGSKRDGAWKAIRGGGL
jgi:hypothetical protein